MGEPGIGPKPVGRKFAVAIGVAIGVSVVALVLNIVTVLAAAPYAPLGDYPVQRVNNQVVGEPGPAVYFTAKTVSITGTKCANQTTDVSGSFGWVAINPAGGTFRVGSGNNTRNKGCTTTTFENVFPEEVVERIKVLAAQGTYRTVWQLAGQETPISPTGTVGVTVKWESQNFTVIYRPEVDDQRG